MWLPDTANPGFQKVSIKQPNWLPTQFPPSPLCVLHMISRPIFSRILPQGKRLVVRLISSPHFPSFPAKKTNVCRPPIYAQKSVQRQHQIVLQSAQFQSNPSFLNPKSSLPLSAYLAASQWAPPQKRRDRSTMESMRLLTNSKPALIWPWAVPVVSAMIWGKEVGINHG